MYRTELMKPRAFLSGIIAGLAVLAGLTPQEARADAGPFSGKGELCRVLGCPDQGSLSCITGTAEVNGSYWILKAGGTVTFTCYQTEEGGTTGS
jgi:hypothetical protein